MLHIVVSGQEFWDEKKEEFVYGKDTKLQLEHSLVSISKWESKWHKPFMSNRPKDAKTKEEIIDYIRCMTLTQNVDKDLYKRLSSNNIDSIVAYINDSMTATWFREDDVKKKKSGYNVTTSEQVYYLMIKFGIPFECQKWHINRLMTLIQVCEEEEKNHSRNNKKLTSKDLSKRSALNAARKKKLHTRG